MKTSFYFSIFLLFQSWILLLLPSLISDEHYLTILYLLLYLNLIFFLFLFIIYKIFKTKFDKNFQYFLTSIFVLSVFIGLVLSNLNFFLSLDPFLKLIIILISLILLYFVIFLIDKNKFSIYFLIFFVAFQILSIIFDQTYFKNKKNYQTNYNLNIKLDKKPNIFIFSFDGLAPNSILKKDYNIDLKYEINSENLIILSNSFNENIYTKPALNTLFF